MDRIEVCACPTCGSTAQAIAGDPVTYRAINNDDRYRKLRAAVLEVVVVEDNKEELLAMAVNLAEIAPEGDADALAAIQLLNALAETY